MTDEYDAIIEIERIVQGGEKSFSAVIDEFFTFDSIEMQCKESAAKSTSTLNFKVKNFFFVCIVFYSSRK